MFLRDGTQDFQVFGEVVLQDEYGLLDAGLRPGDLVVDVGANVGCFAYMALRAGARRLVCLEPEDANYALLRENMAPYRDRAALELRREALWRSGPGPAAPPPGLVRARGGQHTAMHRLSPGQGEPVASVGLDELLKGRGPVRLLKLDCEGAEYPGLYTSSCLGDVGEVVAEVHLQLPWHGSPIPCTAEDVARFLSAQGFAVSVTPHHKSPDHLAMVRGTRPGGWR